MVPSSKGLPFAGGGHKPWGSGHDRGYKHIPDRSCGWWGASGAIPHQDHTQHNDWQQLTFIALKVGLHFVDFLTSEDITTYDNVVASLQASVLPVFFNVFLTCFQPFYGRQAYLGLLYCLS